ncbi:MAG: hypothetical protein FJY81_00690 [Candidatus Aminicenantes bacterium]|nr:hypothetical protein [Candidatus Aminicenantes bacterium]
MKTNKTISLTLAFLVLALFNFNACKRSAVEEPAPLGPSSFAILLHLHANPNVLFAGLNSRQMTTITATLKKYDGTPIPGKTLFFETISSTGTRVDLGYFEGNQAMLSKTTDSSGSARITYYGPLSEEILANATLYIRATVAWEGSQFIYETAPLYIIRDADQISFIVEAIPSVLFAGDSNPTSEIRARLSMGGVPVQDYPVYFILEQPIGIFDDGLRQTYALTNAEGVASKTYVGPTWVEIATNEVTVTINVILSDTISERVTLQIIRKHD